MGYPRFTGLRLTTSCDPSLVLAAVLVAALA